MSTCRQTRRLSAYHDGEVSAEEHAALEAHLAECPACAAELERLRRLSALLAQTMRPVASPRPTAPGPRARAADLGRVARTFLAVAASVLLVCAAWLWGARASDPSAEPIPVWEAAACQGTLAAGSQEQLAQWIVLDLERKSAHD